MSLPDQSLDLLLPMHLRLDASGRVAGAGPTLAKLLPATPLPGRSFAEILDIYRPRPMPDLDALLAHAGRKLQLRLCNSDATVLRGVAVPDGAGGLLLNLSFGFHVVEAVRDFALTSTDFAVTDLAIDMLYLVEAKSAAMEASRTLNRRLQGAMLAAEQRAFTDTLTGLRNRRGLTQALDRQLRSGRRFAVMHIDLDYFKEVNDSHGHATGDRVLQAVARAMLGVMRKGDTVARMGGDEFVIVLDELVDRIKLAELAARLIRRIEQPVPVEGVACEVSASIGIALGGAPDLPTLTQAELLDRADVALYRAKRRGRAQYAFFSAERAEAATPPPG